MRSLVWSLYGAHDRELFEGLKTQEIIRIWHKLDARGIISWSQWLVTVLETLLDYLRYSQRFINTSLQLIYSEESINISVCVPWLNFLSDFLSWILHSRVSTVPSLLCLPSSPRLSSLSFPSRWTSTSPLSSVATGMVDISMSPLLIWFLRASVSAKPLISPCKSLRGRSKVRQQEKDQCGFFRHSFK